MSTPDAAGRPAARGSVREAPALREVRGARGAPAVPAAREVWEHRHRGWGLQRRSTPRGSSALSSVLTARHRSGASPRQSRAARTASAAHWWSRRRSSTGSGRSRAWVAMAGQQASASASHRSRQSWHTGRSGSNRGPTRTDTSRSVTGRWRAPAWARARARTGSMTCGSSVRVRSGMVSSGAPVSVPGKRATICAPTASSSGRTAPRPASASRAASSWARGPEPKSATLLARRRTARERGEWTSRSQYCSSGVVGLEPAPRRTPSARRRPRRSWARGRGTRQRREAR